MRSKQSRIVIIGLDGMPYGLIKDLAENGTMPNMKALIEEGAFRQMASSIPEISSVAWSSIITGKNPGEHGIFGFTDLMPNSYSMYFPGFRNLCTKPFWERENSPRSVIINVPSTYPAREFNGVLISGFVALDLKKATYPSSLVPKLKEMGYKMDVDSQKGHKSIDLFLHDLQATLDARIAAYRYLWKQEEWQNFMLVFTGTDRLAHFLWEAYEDKSHEYHSVFLDHLHQVDAAIGEIVDSLSEDESMLLLSDHGFESLDREVYTNAILKKAGLLLFEDNSTNLRDIDQNAKAFALDPARIYIHTKDRYPRGNVTRTERESIINDIVNLFAEIKIDGREVIRAIYRKEEIFSGPLMDQAPDLVLVADKGFNMKANTKVDALYGNGPFTGKHSQPDAFLLIKANKDVDIPVHPHVSDVVGILDQLQRRK